LCLPKTSVEEARMVEMTEGEENLAEAPTVVTATEVAMAGQRGSGCPPPLTTRVSQIALVEFLPLKV
jgi:hypothetical protein